MKRIDSHLNSFSCKQQLHSLITLWVLSIALLSSAIAGSPSTDSPFIDDRPHQRDLEYPDWFTHSFLNLHEDLEDAQQSGKKGIIVYFGQKDCAYCEALLETNFGSEKDIVDYTQKHFDVIPLDIWGSREVIDMTGQTLTEREFAEFEGTNFTPSLIFYTAEGEEALRLRGYYPPYKFRGALEYVTGDFYQRESFRDYLARADPPPKFEIGDMNSDESFEQPPYFLERNRIQASRPLAVFFEQQQCHACDILHSEPLQDERSRELLDKFDKVQLDMWSDTPVLTPQGGRLSARQWAAKLGVFYAPTIVFFDESGNEVLRVDSVVRLYRLRGVLDFIASRGYRDAPTFQRWRENMQNAARQNSSQ